MFVVDGVTVKNASEEWFSELWPIYQGCRALNFTLDRFSRSPFVYEIKVSETSDLKYIG